MTLRGWLNTLDSFTPRCSRCNRKIRNVHQCRTCGTRVCSESCMEKHFNLMHAPQLQKQQAEAALQKLQDLHKQHEQTLAAELKKERQQRKEEADTAHARQKKLERLRAEIKTAKAQAADCLEAWKQAGSPVIQPTELNGAKEEARRRRAPFRKAKAVQGLIVFKIAYLRLARLARRVGTNTGRVAAPIIGGAVFFAVGMLVALLATRSLGLAFGLDGAGFLVGLAATLTLLFFPHDQSVQKGMGSLSEYRAKQVEIVRGAKLAYEDARQKFTHLARLHKLRTDYERATCEKEELEEEYECLKLSLVAGSRGGS